MTQACAATIPSIKLNDGHLHPSIGYGTYKVGVVPSSASSAVAAGSVRACRRIARMRCIRQREQLFASLDRVRARARRQRRTRSTRRTV